VIILHVMQTEHLQIWEAWRDPDDDSVVFSSQRELKIDNTLSERAFIIHRLHAATYEEARAILNLRMGWDAFVPQGEGKECPNSCGSYYYPEHSSTCPYCGKIRTQQTKA